MLPSSLGRGLALISCAWLARGLDVPVSFFTGTDCKNASTITPSAPLSLSTCILTPGLVSLYYGIIPCSGGGTVVPLLYKDTACTNQQGILDFYKTGSDVHCLSDYASGSISAIMLTCNQKQPEQPQATRTVSVAPVATGATASATPRASSSSEPWDFGIKKGWASLSTGARIGIIVGASVFGLIVIACLLWCCCCCGSSSPSSSYDRPYNNNYDSSWKTPATTTQEVPPRLWDFPGDIAPPSHELSGVSRDDAYAQVLDNVAKTARQHADSGYFDNGDAHSGATYSGDVLPPGIISTAFSRDDRDWKHQLGAAGELYVFEYLRSLGLPNFGTRNWTSSLRTRCESHPEYSGLGTCTNGIADIEYYDESGLFTEFLLAQGYSGRGIRSGMRPTYFFEIKATTSANRQTPFYMSSTQETHVREAMITPNQTDRVYIVCRISNLGSGSRTRLDVYLDPQTLRQEGRLAFSRATGWDDGYWVTPV
ncbi:hypothetical protein E5D57_007880 [Metarhizium anisopliae]|nr:hypothetical protein E5D57_007880 [Metarhizium anisopliae]